MTRRIAQENQQNDRRFHLKGATSPAGADVLPSSPA
jgi:hypothetical protein